MSLKQEIAVYIAQNKAVVVVVELFKGGKFFMGHPVALEINRLF